MRTITALLTIAWLAAANVSAQDDAGKERQRVQGTWTFVSVEMDGKNLDLFEGAKVVVKEDRRHAESGTRSRSARFNRGRSTAAAASFNSTSLAMEPPLGCMKGQNAR